MKGLVHLVTESLLWRLITDGSKIVDDKLTLNKNSIFYVPCQIEYGEELDATSQEVWAWAKTQGLVDDEQDE